jgi:hypothetical protein
VLVTSQLLILHTGVKKGSISASSVATKRLMCNGLAEFLGKIR